MTVVSKAVPFVTVNPLTSVTTSVPVVRVTLRVPSAAAGSILKTTVAVVTLFAVTEATVIPVPKLAVVVPWTQCVKRPKVLLTLFTGVGIDRR